MKIIPTSIPEVLIIEPKVFTDERGKFMETYHQSRYVENKINVTFVQDNLSYSKKHTLRGLHYQYPNAQAKLVQVLKGEVFDVAVDIRFGSPTFGKWVGEILSDQNCRQLYIPKGFAHGFCVLSEEAIFSYKCSDFFTPENESGVIWNDPDICIEWPLKNPILSDKDQNFSRLKDSILISIRKK
ncbi:MAG: dTDP-4-dehydrorhamnose 3,5-epimerase [Desulfobacteraceae bacterium]|nr:dTDP-4-dehydrorhamnose 3,5-epimerase [Desulfobacteraceae bacterium]